MNLLYRTTKWQQRSPGVALRGFLGDVCVGAGSFNWPCNTDASDEIKRWPELMFVQSNYSSPNSNKGQLFTPEGREWFKTSYGRYPDPKFNAPPYTIPPDPGGSTYLTPAQILASVAMTVNGNGVLVPASTTGSGSTTTTPSGSTGSGSHPVTTPIIPGVDNTLLYAGAAAGLVVLILMMRK